MTSRKGAFGLGVALSLALSYLGSSATVLAQAADAPQTGAAAAPGDDAAAAEDAPADAAAAEEEPAAKPEEEEAKEPAAEPAKEPAVAATATGTVTAAEVPSTPEPAPESGAAILAVAELPPSAYPSVQIRGLANGSLARTFHGQQWPYLPGIEERHTLQIGLSGYVWNDLSNTRIDVDRSLAGSNVNDQNRWTTQTRGVLRVTPTYNAQGGWFAQANGEFVVQGDMLKDISTGVLATTDDLWVRAGMWNVFDVTVGRFQGWEIANHYGMALDINTLERAGAWVVTASQPKPTDGYGLTYFWDRQNYTLGGYALHVYPTKFLRGEILGHVGAGDSIYAANPYQADVRPAAIFDIGFLKLKGGFEYGVARPQDAGQVVRESKNGYGFAAQVVLDPYVEFGGSFGRGFQDVIDQEEEANLEASNTVQTVGGFLNLSPGHEPLVLGGGAFLNSWENFRIDQNAGPHQGKVDTNDQWLVFGAVQYTVWTRLNLKFVFSSASNKVEHYRHGIYVNNALSGRFRAELLF